MTAPNLRWSVLESGVFLRIRPPPEKFPGFIAAHPVQWVGTYESVDRRREESKQSVYDVECPGACALWGYTIGFNSNIIYSQISTQEGTLCQ